MNGSFIDVGPSDQYLCIYVDQGKVELSWRVSRSLDLQFNIRKTKRRTLRLTEFSVLDNFFSFHWVVGDKIKVQKLKIKASYAILIFSVFFLFF